MNKKLYCAALIGLGLMLGGCGLVDYPDMSDQEEGLITEYAAGLILRYDGSFNGDFLLNDEELASAEAEEAEEKARKEKAAEAAAEYLSKEANAESNSSKNADSVNTESAATATTTTIDNIASFYGLDGFTVTYTGASLTDSYPDDDRDDYFMALDASDGYHLLVAKFNVVNTGSEAADFDMFSKNSSFTAVIDGSQKTKAQPTLLLDDMSSYTGSLEPGADNQMVLIFEVPDTINQITSLSLEVKNGDSKGTIVLQ